MVAQGQPRAAPHPTGGSSAVKGGSAAPIEKGRPPPPPLLMSSPRRRCFIQSRLSRNQRNPSGSLQIDMLINQRQKHLLNVWNLTLFCSTTVRGRCLPSLLAMVEMFIIMLSFGFLKFLWLTCKAPRIFGDLKLGTKLVLQAYSSGGSSWVLDSGCTNHMTGERSMFLSVFWTGGSSTNE